jgi:hypothetical protein
MRRDRSAHALGRVVARDQTPVRGALVYVVGHNDITATTGPQGQFDIPANAALGEYLRLHVEKQGYNAEEQVVIAGNATEEIILTKRQR